MLGRLGPFPGMVGSDKGPISQGVAEDRLIQTPSLHLIPRILGLSRKIVRHAVFLNSAWTPLPLSLTVSVTRRCNLTCPTCGIHTRRGSDLSPDELSRLAASLKLGVPWITFTGGEPFLREDLREIISQFCATCRPVLVNVATNGTVPRTGEIMRGLALKHPKTAFTVNVSLDEVGELHDQIRGKEGVFRAASSLVRNLKREAPNNLNVGVHLVISRLNLHRLPSILPRLRQLGADQLIVEPAQERWELANQGFESVPEDRELRQVMPFLIRDLERAEARGVVRLSRAARLFYYSFMLGAFRGGIKRPPCRAGRLSAHVDADGAVSACCVRGDPMGRLSEHNFDFSQLWNGVRARQTRRMLETAACSCHMANAFFTGMVLDPRAVVQLAALSMGRSRKL